jgi:hypothetical protein
MNVSQSMKMSFSKSFATLRTRKDVLYMIVFVLALMAFEAFNYSTTDFALSDLLGGLRFAGIPWATLLSIAFCGIDFAGIALLLAPQAAKDDSPFWLVYVWRLDSGGYHERYPHLVGGCAGCAIPPGGERRGC